MFLVEDVLEIYGGTPLEGTVVVGGAKNAALPILLATLLSAERCSISNLPELYDVSLLCRLLTQLGAHIEPRQGDGVLSLRIPELISFEASYSLVKSLRASFWVLAPLLARGRSARVAMPGGDLIGARPVDIHLEALSQMGADIRVRNGVVIAEAPQGLSPRDITFRFPSVGATHQILMAAALTKGTTTLRNAAREPEVVALASVLREMGARIEGAGEAEISVTGREELGGFSTRIIGDRIEAATYILATVAARGKTEITGFCPEDLGSFLSFLTEMGASVETTKEGVQISMTERPKSVQVVTGPFPEFATDIQAQLMAALTVAEGESSITETVYEGRFGHVSELSRMGAKISLSGQTAIVHGVPRLLGASVEARDIRAGAAMVVAGLAAHGRTSIEECQHLRRGYERLEEKLRALGARVVSTMEEKEDFSFIGC